MVVYNEKEIEMGNRKKKVSKPLQKIRFDVMAIQDVLPLIEGDSYSATNREIKKYVEIHGVRVKSSSTKHPFFKKSQTCWKCGLKASYFGIEKFKSEESYVFELYGLRPDGTEVLFTKGVGFPLINEGEKEIAYKTTCNDCRLKLQKENVKPNKVNLCEKLIARIKSFLRF